MSINERDALLFPVDELSLKSLILPITAGTSDSSYNTSLAGIIVINFAYKNYLEENHYYYHELTEVGKSIKGLNLFRNLYE